MQHKVKRLSQAALCLFALFAILSVPHTANAGNYGCYVVTAPKSVNIRAKAWSKSAVIGSAKRGTVLIKWKPICAIRGYWCPVQLGRIKGHAAKEYLEKTACP